MGILVENGTKKVLRKLVAPDYAWRVSNIGHRRKKITSLQGYKM